MSNCRNIDYFKKWNKRHYVTKKMTGKSVTVDGCKDKNSSSAIK